MQTVGMRTPRPQPGHPQAEQGEGEDNGTDDETNRTEDAKTEEQTNEQRRNQARPPGGQEEQGDRNTSKCKARQTRGGRRAPDGTGPRKQ